MHIKEGGGGWCAMSAEAVAEDTRPCWQCAFCTEYLTELPPEINAHVKEAWAAVQKARSDKVELMNETTAGVMLF